MNPVGLLNPASASRNKGSFGELNLLQSPVRSGSALTGHASLSKIALCFQVVGGLQFSSPVGKLGRCSLETEENFFPHPHLRITTRDIRRQRRRQKQLYARPPMGPDETGKTIGERLMQGFVADSDDEDNESMSVPLATDKSKLEIGPLTISQRRNIKRQSYLDKVSKRNDVPFFTTVALFVILPPLIILGFAVVTGYIDLSR